MNFDKHLTESFMTFYSKKLRSVF